MLNAVEITTTDGNISFSESSSKMKDVMEDLNIPDPKTSFSLLNDLKCTQAAAEAERNDCEENNKPEKLSREELIFKILSN